MRRSSGLAVIALISGCCACSGGYAQEATSRSALAPLIDPFLPALEGKAVVTLPEFRKRLQLHAAGTAGDGNEVISRLRGTRHLVLHAFTSPATAGPNVDQLMVTTRERRHGPPIVQKVSMTFAISQCLSANSMIATYGLRPPRGWAPVADPPPPPQPGTVVHASPEEPAEPFPDARTKYERRFAGGTIWAYFAWVPIFVPKCVWRFGMVFHEARR